MKGDAGRAADAGDLGHGLNRSDLARSQDHGDEHRLFPDGLLDRLGVDETVPVDRNQSRGKTGLLQALA